MDYVAYRKAFFTDPEPTPRFNITDFFGITLYFEQYEEAVSYYSRVLGPPAYIEGDFTMGWKVGEIWLTLLRAAEGNPKNAEIQLALADEEEASRLHEAFSEAGGTIEEPAEVLMYEAVKIFPVTDPFGTTILLVVRQ